MSSARIPDTLPDLILQMQRMGDIILTFPLLAWLQAQEPQRPLWLVAEEVFFRELMHFAPKVTFFPPEASSQLCTARYNRVINASHRDKGLALAGALQCAELFGAYAQDDTTHIHGAWMLYRAAIVENNRHNRFHWSDLYALDSVQRSIIQDTQWPEPRHAQQGKTGRIGLFVGASERAKHPSAEFWADLAVRLLHFGLKPLFLGGTADMPLAAEAEQHSGLTGANFAGRFHLAELAHCIQGLDLLICPDTGPMHLAAWSGTQVLNLSMGNVNAWETSPMQPGHYVVSSTISCHACWHCTQKTWLCHRAFTPQAIASIARTIMKKPQSLESLRLHGLALHRTARDVHGLHTLQRLDAHTPVLRDCMGEFWRQTFWGLLENNATECSAAWEQLEQEQPMAFKVLLAALNNFQKSLNACIRKKSLPDSHFWQKNPPLLWPLTGYISLLFQNESNTAHAWQKSIQILENLKL